jgi:hypothetical protein
MGPLASVTGVAEGVFRTSPCGSVVVVAEVPWCAWLDELVALGAADFACLDLGFPLPAQ